MSAIVLSSFKGICKKRIFHFIDILTILYFVLFAIIFRVMSKNLSKNADMMNTISNLSSTISVVGFIFQHACSLFKSNAVNRNSFFGLESGAIITILTKPIKQRKYILEKYLDTAILIILYNAILYVVVVIISTISKISIIEAFGIAALIKCFLFLFFILLLFQH